jgi:tetratricopeptide (TPR) repeat protein
MDRIFNFGASLIKGGREEEALAWAGIAGEKYPHDPRWGEFIFTALNNLLAGHIRSGRVSQARPALNRYAPLLDAENFTDLNARVTEAELAERAGRIRSAAEAEAAIAAVEQAASLLPADRIGELRGLVVIREGERLAAAEGFRRAVAYMEAAIRRYGKSNRLTAVLERFRANRMAEIHNAFAELYNRKGYEEALRVILEGLEELPGSRQLNADRTLAERALRGR